MIRHSQKMPKTEPGGYWKDVEVIALVSVLLITGGGLVKFIKNYECLQESIISHILYQRIKVESILKIYCNCKCLHHDFGCWTQTGLENVFISKEGNKILLAFFHISMYKNGKFPSSC